jgi:hypothetical protein
MVNTTKEDRVAKLRKQLAEAEAAAADKQKNKVTKLMERRALVVQRIDKLHVTLEDIDAEIAELAVESIPSGSAQLTFTDTEVDEV